MRIMFSMQCLQVAKGHCAITCERAMRNVHAHGELKMYYVIWCVLIDDDDDEEDEVSKS